MIFMADIPRVGILTVSDRSARGERDDASGPVIRAFVEERLTWTVAEQQIVPDEREKIRETLIEIAPLVAGRAPPRLAHAPRARSDVAIRPADLRGVADRGRPWPLLSVREPLPAEVDEVVLRALEKEPDRRYTQVSELKTQVETIAATPHASDESSASASGSTCQKNRRLGSPVWTSSASTP